MKLKVFYELDVDNYKIKIVINKDNETIFTCSAYIVFSFESQLTKGLDDLKLKLKHFIDNDNELVLYDDAHIQCTTCVSMRFFKDSLAVYHSISPNMSNINSYNKFKLSRDELKQFKEEFRRIIQLI